MKKVSKITAVVLALAMVFSVFSSALTADEMSGRLSNWLKSNVTVAAAQKKVDSQLDWTVFALSRNGDKGMNEEYKTHIDAAVKASERLYLSDYARISLAAMAAGIDPADIGGKDLLKLIADTKAADEVYTGGVAYALIALQNAKTDYTEAAGKLKDVLLSAQRSDGGFNTYIKEDPANQWSIDSDVDSTGIVLQALAAYKGEEKVDKVIGKAIDYFKKNQMDNAAFGGWGSVSAESTAMVILALCELGIDPAGKDFTKDGKTMIDALSDFVNSDGGGKCWDGSSAVLTSYQMLMALNSYKRFTEGKAGFFKLSRLAVLKDEIGKNELLQKIPFVTDLIIAVLNFIIPIFVSNYYSGN